MKIYYDEISDYLEIFIENPRPDYGEEVADGVTLFRDQETGEVFGVGVIGFKKRAKNLQEIKLDLPLDISLLARQTD